MRKTICVLGAAGFVLAATAALQSGDPKSAAASSKVRVARRDE